MFSGNGWIFMKWEQCQNPLFFSLSWNEVVKCSFMHQGCFLCRIQKTHQKCFLCNSWISILDFWNPKNIGFQFSIFGVKKFTETKIGSHFWNLRKKSVQLPSCCAKGVVFDGDTGMTINGIKMRVFKCFLQLYWLSLDSKTHEMASKNFPNTSANPLLNSRTYKMQSLKVWAEMANRDAEIWVYPKISIKFHLRSKLAKHPKFDVAVTLF